MEKLTEINVYKDYGVPDKKIQFEYEDKPTERLFLKKMKISGITESSIDKTAEYGFYYNAGNDTDYTFNGSLPSYLYPGVDFMGYYNGPSPVGSPTYASLQDYVNSLYTVNISSISNKGVLYKIVYPTKGETRFKFEKNTYSKYMDISLSQLIYLQSAGTNYYASGLRIKTITNIPDPGSAKTEVTNYQYLTNLSSTESSGYFSHPQEGSIVRYDPVAGQIQTYLNYHLSHYYGSHIQYNKVFETKTDEQGTFSTEYTYTDPTMFIHKAWISKFSAVGTLDLSASFKCTDYSMFYGKLLSKKVYDKTGTLQKNSLYSYRSDLATLENLTVKGVMWQGVIPAVLYKTYYGDYDVVRETTTENFGGNYITTVTDFTKNDYPYKYVGGVPKYNGSRRDYGTVGTNSRDEATSNIVTYQFNCSSGDCFNNPFGLVKNTSSVVAGSTIARTELTYMTVNANPQSYAVNEINVLKGGLAEGKKTTVTNDEQGKVLAYKQDSELSSTTNYIYGYSGNKIVAKITGVPYSAVSPYVNNIQILATSYYGPLGETGHLQKETDLRNALNAFRNSLPEAMVTTYTYDSHLRVKTITLPNGYIEFYQYDGLGRLIKVADKDGKILNASEYHFKD